MANVTVNTFPDEPKLHATYFSNADGLYNTWTDPAFYPHEETLWIDFRNF